MCLISNTIWHWMALSLEYIKDLRNERITRQSHKVAPCVATMVLLIWHLSDDGTVNLALKILNEQ